MHFASKACKMQDLTLLLSMTIRWQTVGNEPPTRRCLQTPCGLLMVSGVEGVVTALQWLTEGGEATKDLPGEGVAVQLQRYFGNPLQSFDCRLALVGTPFQRRVWRALLAIPVGQTRCYGDLAGELGSSPRAVAAACRANPYPVIVPCHRVVAKSGLGGYCGEVSGPMSAIKHWLLGHEGGSDESC